METNELKPCPFCGEILETEWDKEEHSFFLMHKTIFCDCPLHLGFLITAPDEKSAIAKWNRRADNGKEDI